MSELTTDQIRALSDAELNEVFDAIGESPWGGTVSDAEWRRLTDESIRREQKRVAAEPVKPWPADVPRGWSNYSRARRHSGDTVGAMLGLDSPRAPGHCHYCGQPLRRGACDECD